MTENNKPDALHPRHASSMTKGEALALLGGTQREIAERIGCTPQAVQAWPQVLSTKLRDRVQAVLWREHSMELRMESVRLQRLRERLEAQAQQQQPRATPALLRTDSTTPTDSGDASA